MDEHVNGELGQLQGGKWGFCHCSPLVVAALLGLSFGQEDHSPNSHLLSATPEFWLQSERRPLLSQPQAPGLQALRD